MNPNVDFTETTSCLEWCAGYGGISLGVKRAIPSLRTIAFGEIEAFACANLVAKMEAGLLDPAPIWTDLKTFPCEQFRDRVDILVAGYPCQPFSTAGKRLGTEDPRHLWPFIQRSISIIRPRLCFFENVEGHITLGLSTVISDLEELGYKVSWGIFSASEVGAPHQRKRVFILAHRDCERGQLSDWRKFATEQMPISDGTAGRNVWPSRPGEPQRGWEPPRVVDSTSARQQTQRHESNSQRREGFAGEPSELENSKLVGRGGRSDGDAGRVCGEIQATGSCGGGAEAMGNADPRRLASGINAGSGTQADRGGECDIEQAECRKVERTMGLHSNGTSVGMGHAELSSLSHSELAEIREWMVKTDNRTDELRLLGNGVVPATAERAFRVLRAELLTADTQ
jgi:DNA (cytosine-5)-methyltransferase 1